jgi:two-component system LytT family sensor kinase
MQDSSLSEARGTSPPQKWWTWWLASALWWTFDGITTAINMLWVTRGSPNAVPWTQALETAMWSAWLWVPVTVWAIWLSDRCTLDRGSWLRLLPVHVASAIAVCVVRGAAVVVVNPRAGWYDTVPGFGTVLITSFANNFLLYWTFVGVGHALVYARRFRLRDEQLAQAELQNLRMQLHPHFLFNALNTVNSYVRTDPATAERMIARLSQLLRHALAGGGQQEVPLEEELRIVQAYLEIEQARFEDRLQVRWRVEPSARAAIVPSLILQPLVENAVRHGIAPSAMRGTIEIAAERGKRTLRLTVRDDGVGIAPGQAAREGVGLANTRARLRQLYGARQSLELTEEPGGGVCVRVTLPLRLDQS